MFKASQSKVKTWRRCKYQYHLKYVEKLRRKRVKRPLMFGRIVHEMLDAEADGSSETAFEKLDEIATRDSKMFAAEREEYGDIIDDVEIIMCHYFEFWPEKEFKPTIINGRRAEHEFEIEIMKDVLWNGRIDKIGHTPNRLRWLLENKTFNRRPGEDERWRNLQSATYIRAIDMMGWKSVDGTCWNYIWSKSPPRPRTLKDGSMSKSKIITLPIAYEEGVKQAGLNVKKYKKQISDCEQNLSEWFFRIFTPVSKSVVDNLMLDFEASIIEMIEGHGKAKEKNIDRHCGWCEFESICRAELTGGDVDYVKYREYLKDGKSTKAPAASRKARVRSD